MLYPRDQHPIPPKENKNFPSHGADSVGGRTYSDTIKSGIQAGELGFMEFFHQRERYWRNESLTYKQVII